MVLYAFVGVSLALSRRDRDQLSRLARTDPLTGLLNTRTFVERLQEESPRLRRRPEPFCIAYVDLDNFKQINDRFGHAAGDAALAEVATRLRATVREGDLTARLGGDEFAIVFWSTTAEQGERLATRMVEAVAEVAIKARGTAPRR